MTNIEFYNNDVWSDVLKAVKESGQVNEETYDLYYINSRLITLNDDKALVLVPEFINFAAMNSNLTLIENCLENRIGKYIPVKIKTEEEYRSAKDPVFQVPYSREIDERMNFGNFIIGKSNIKAQNASMLVANNLGLMYNPLFIYGNSGLGKTHLLNAIGNDITNRNPRLKICFVSGENFVDGVFKASKDKTLDEFKEAFYNVDLLLVDDIEFISGKSKSQEVFFSIFNNLVNNKKQICLTADKLPSEIEGLEERIISRFNQGLTVNIEAPEYETSLNIVKAKLKSSTDSGQEIEDEVFQFIASNFSQDVRSLSGAVNRLLFYNISYGTGEKITLEFAKEAFKDQIDQTKGELTIKQIKKIVCDYYNLTSKQLVSKSRTSNIANARHICMYLCKKLLDSPYEEIGKEFGGKDHSTVISACRKIDDLIKTNDLYKKAVSDIEIKLNK